MSSNHSSGMSRGPMGHGRGRGPAEKAKDFKGTMAKLIRYLGSYRINIIIAFLLSIVSVALMVIGPKILGNSTGLSSFWVLFSILFFGGLFGFVGMIIAVPAFAVIYDLISRAVHRSLRLRKLPMETDEYRKLDHIDEKTGMFMELNKK